MPTPTPASSVTRSQHTFQNIARAPGLTAGAEGKSAHGNDMDPQLLSILGIVLGLATLITLALRGWSIILIAPMAAVIVLAFSRVDLLTGLNEDYMKGFSSFAMKFFFLFLLGTIFGKVMEDSGAARKIADVLLRLTGKSNQLHVAMAIVAVCALLGYGGVSVFVILFVIVPIARPLFKEIDLSWHLFPGIYFFGVATFVMSMVPGTPQIQNIIPTKYLGTTAMAAPALGLIASVFVITANYFLLGWMIRRAKRKGEGYEGTDPAAAKAAPGEASGDKALPSIWPAFTPSIVLLVLLNIVQVDIVWALLGGIAAGMILLSRHLPDKLKTLTGGATNCALPVINTCADVGFGAVVGSVAGFKSISNMLLSIPGTPLISLSLATQLLCGITGSASGGLGIAMELFAKQFLALGLNPEVIHRVASLATAGLDVMPHNGAVITALAVVGLTHKQAYKPIFMLAVVTPILTNALAIVIAMTIY
ncbi:GntP family permease [Variovorax ureilyticus]|uniref:GntP family permease n=1 Tax=Variovorax ureilyticus TaxID=1836198 RepID=A0ABU8VLL3_9BURK